MTKVLIIDGEPQIRKLLRLTLKSQHYVVAEAMSGEEGIHMARTFLPDLILLDLALPDMHGTAVLKEIRTWSNIPILVLTVNSQEADKVTAFDQGADDYMTKPFSTGELLARIRAALRRLSPHPDLSILVWNDVTIDLSEHRVTRGQEVVKLTPTEYDLLRVLAVNVGRVVTHAQLLTQVWGHADTEADAHYLRIYIGHLRKKLEQEPNRPTLILTEPSVGYRLSQPSP